MPIFTLGGLGLKSVLLKSMILIIIVYVLIVSAVVASSAETDQLKAPDGHGDPFSDYYSNGYFSGYNSSENYSLVQLENQNRITQAPATLSIGRGYYSSHPISYGSEICSGTWIKNERSATSMHHDVNYAHGLDGGMEVAATDGSYIQDNFESGSMATTHMKVDENVTDGKVQVGVLQGSDASGQNAGKGGTDPLMDAWKNPAMQIEEDYIGTFHIYKNMTINSSYDQEKRSNSWLNCYSDSYFNMNRRDPISINADQVFNCELIPKLK